jgi:hypothetical protein
VASNCIFIFKTTQAFESESIELKRNFASAIARLAVQLQITNDIAVQEMYVARYAEQLIYRVVGIATTPSFLFHCLVICDRPPQNTPTSTQEHLL